MSVNKVLYNIDQRSNTSDAEKATARQNIGEWGQDDLCQVVAGMNRTWFVRDGDMLDQNGIGSWTQTLKSGTLTIKFDFVFRV